MSNKVKNSDFKSNDKSLKDLSNIMKAAEMSEKPEVKTQLSIDARRYSTDLHLNPHRSRTPGPRLSIPVSESTEISLDFEKPESKEETFTTGSEKTPLLKESSLGSIETNSSKTFSHTISLERSQRRILGISLYGCLSSLRCYPMDVKQTLIALKILALFVITVLCCVVIAINDVEEEDLKLSVLHPNSSEILYTNLMSAKRPYLRVYIHGPFITNQYYNGTSETIRMYTNPENVHNISINMSALELHESYEITNILECPDLRDERMCTLTMETDVEIPVSWSTRRLTHHYDRRVVYAFLVLAFVYVLIIFELVHRTLAALLGALAALAVLAAIHERPSLSVIVGWMDTETLTLLFGMMIVVAIFSETGFFDYSALMAYKFAKGQIWPLVTLLCILSGVVSAFLDNVTTILLMAPVTIRLCEALNLDPKQILMAEVLFSNIGGSATAIGDPPNVIIVGALDKQGITFSTFTVHMFPGILLVSVFGYLLLRFYYRDLDALKNKDPPDIAEMRHEIAMWRRTANRTDCVTREETLMRALFLQKAVEIEHAMQKTIHRKWKEKEDDMKDTLKKLERQYSITDYSLLVKSGCVMLTVILLLFMYSFVNGLYLGIGWIAVLGALWLLVLADMNDMDNILHKVEWSTLLFFAALFILMEALAELGMIKTIGDAISNIVTSVGEEHRLSLALLVIIWVSAIASSFIDNIPFTTAMVPVLQQLCEDPKVSLPLLPMVIALACGACLGGNGTLIGASCNVVCAGIAEQHGYGFSFRDFFKVGFPMMLVTTVIATAYVMFCHVAVSWNSV